MSKLDQQFFEDRQLRDAARAVFTAEISHARTSFSAKGVADRVGSRIGDGTKDVLEIAKVHADDNRGILAVIIGAVLLWFAHEPILEILGLADAQGNTDEGDADQDASLVSSPSETETPSGTENEH